jgi:transglutaminase/protease-like cytokinesis protein 3
MKKLILFIALTIINSSIAQISDFSNIDFDAADNIAKLYKGSDLNNLPLLAHNLTVDLPTDVEKFRAIYTWVCNNIDGDPKQDNEVIAKRKEFKNDNVAYLKWQNEFKKIAFKKLFKQQKTMCTGYAYLIKELSFLADIECEIIDGYGRTTASNVDDLDLTNHSWNAVKLNDKWYLADATWSSGYFDDYNVFINDYNDGYFLTDPILFAQSHYPINKKWLLNNTLINSEFVASPIVYGETYKHKIIPISPQKLNLTAKRFSEVEFSFKALKDIDLGKISMVQIMGVKEKPFKIYDIKEDNGLVSFKYKFKYKKHYDVHIKIDDDYVATYTIKVSDKYATN